MNINNKDMALNDIWTELAKHFDTSKLTTTERDAIEINIRIYAMEVSLEELRNISNE